MERKEYSYLYKEEKEIDIVDFIFIFFRRWKLILMVLTPIFILGFVYATTRPSLYRAQTTLMVSTPTVSVGLDNSDFSLSQRLVVTYSEIAKSRSVLNNVILKYDLPEEIEKLSKNINVSTIDETGLIKLSYTNQDPKLAAAVINEIAKEFTNKIVEVMNVRNVKVVEVAEIPTKSLPKKRLFFLSASLVIGLVIGGGMALFIESLHKKLRKSSDIEKILGAEMLGMVPEFSEREIIEEELNE